ncbi:DUF3742 family protein [Burkholderia humptydooensis]|uniref:DUF3742 family protein n=2 Tax=Burkholderia humptydooensis TaxID=430531 RepID=A0A7T2X159_9BURK|nr:MULTISPECIES: DUF3742 family protein [Burkholderia]QPS45620.1 DUF3742 family protein [Burkholderia humptydooensis]
MSTKTHRSHAERLGRWLGRMWRAYVRREREAVAWLVAQGMPAGGATTTLWIVKLGVVAILFYAVFWLALLLIFAVVAAWLAEHGGLDQDDPQPEWREGPNGFGLYDKSNWRIDPHVSDDD